MATASALSCFFIVLLGLLLLQVQVHARRHSCFSAIFSFGDSLQDTGNFAHAFFNTTVSRPRWGNAYFQRPTAHRVGLPLVQPYLAGGDFSKGANFAFAGATALSVNELGRFGVDTTGWLRKNTLHAQISWFQQLLQSDPSFQDPNFLESALFMVGEIGGNDYNAALHQDLPYHKLIRIVPRVIHAISSTITRLIGMGAKTLVVPGNLPIGCIPVWLWQYRRDDPSDYDGNGCLLWLNRFSEYHNVRLTAQLSRLARLYPNVTIAYADYFGAGMRMFSDQPRFGISEPFAACCGGNGHCCRDPEKYASWEGFHPTEATYKAIYEGLVDGPFAIPLLKKKC
ncbi:GDSL esterase/lipase At1g28600-like isoform X2 [Zingiber officinale]|uniref:GDSL esterase/lipase At1g28600-like isoform X2 n=1 Tax=Zingiber officinale TaxID=94328 RepID=UPI001C4DA6DE|nr:GDSL esterase/lipase At1g28600-like isoform X2 [Zingiber officinale]